MKRLIRKADRVIEWEKVGKGYTVSLEGGFLTVDLIPNKSKFDVAINNTVITYAPLPLEEAKQVAMDEIKAKNPAYHFDGQTAVYVEKAEKVLSGRISIDDITNIRMKAFIQGYLDMARGKGYEVESLSDPSLESNYHDGYYAYRTVKNMD